MRPMDAAAIEAQLVKMLTANELYGEQLAEYTRQLDALGRQLDALTPARPRPELLASALWYAEQGLRVFPLRPASKTPMPGSNGCKDATSDAGQIRAWWAAMPDANVAIATGYVVDVIDIDGPVGVKSWATMHDDLPPLVGRVNTPRAGGTHLYVRATGRGNRAGVAPGVDYRGLGGYVVAPPSINADGIAYSWASPFVTEAAAA